MVLHELQELFLCEKDIIHSDIPIPYKTLYKAKKYGFSNQQISTLKKISISTVEQQLKTYNIKPTFKMVDTCAGEFEAQTLIILKLMKVLMKIKYQIRKK